MLVGMWGNYIFHFKVWIHKQFWKWRQEFGIILTITIKWRETDIVDKVVHVDIGHHLILDDWIVWMLLYKAMAVIWKLSTVQTKKFMSESRFRFLLICHQEFGTQICLIICFEVKILSIFFFQILFISGLACVIGLERTFRFFFQKHKVKASVAFFGGIIVVILGWPLVGMICETYGFVLLFRYVVPAFSCQVQSFLNISIIYTRLYRMNQDLCNKLWEVIDLVGRIIFCQATYALWCVIYELHNIKEKTVQLWNELLIYFFKYLCGQFTGVQSMYPEPDYIHYTIIAVIIGLCRTLEVCIEFVQKQPVFTQSVLHWCQLGWYTLHSSHAPKQKI